MAVIDRRHVDEHHAGRCIAAARLLKSGGRAWRCWLKGEQHLTLEGLGKVELGRVKGLRTAAWYSGRRRREGRTAAVRMCKNTAYALQGMAAAAGTATDDCCCIQPVNSSSHALATLAGSKTSQTAVTTAAVQLLLSFSCCVVSASSPSPHLHDLVHPELSGALLTVAALVQLSHKAVLPRNDLGGAGRNIVPKAAAAVTIRQQGRQIQQQQASESMVNPSEVSPANARVVPRRLLCEALNSTKKCNRWLELMCCPCITPLQLPLQGS
jgi:hypothetical protein